MFTDVIMSQERNPASPNCKVFAAETVRGTKDWTDALLWARANVQTMIRVVGEKRYIVFLSRASDVRLTAQKATALVGMHTNAARIDTIANLRLYLHHSRILEDNDDSTSYICSCIDFKKMNKCRHSLGALIRERREVVPAMNRKRARGRPAQAARALQRQ
jgi:hypothetical protein